MEFNQYPAYSVNISDVHLRSEKTLQSPATLVITYLTNEKEKMVKPTPILKPNDPKNPKPPFSQRLAQPKYVPDPTFDFLDQLKQVSIKIPPFWAIKDNLYIEKLLGKLV